LTKYQKPNETVLGLAADPVRKTYWVYTDQSLFELVVGNEDRDVWKVHLDKGQYDTALRYSKVYVLRFWSPFSSHTLARQPVNETRF